MFPASTHNRLAVQQALQVLNQAILEIEESSFGNARYYLHCINPDTRPALVEALHTLFPQEVIHRRKGNNGKFTAPDPDQPERFRTTYYIGLPASTGDLLTEWEAAGDSGLIIVRHSEGCCLSRLEIATLLEQRQRWKPKTPHRHGVLDFNSARKNA